MNQAPIAKTTAFIFARGGSKGCVGKNIRPLAGKPLIGYAIESAKQSPYIARVIVSTDDEAIAQTAIQFGAEVPFMRPPELAQDASPEWLAWQHAITETEARYGKGACDTFVSIPAPCPLRLVEDIDRTIEALHALPEADMLITTATSHSNPYFTMVTKDAAGKVALAATPPGVVARRQDAPKVYDIVGMVYAARRDFIMRASRMWDGAVYTVELPAERCIDIDTEHDFLVADLLMRHRLGMVA